MRTDQPEYKRHGSDSMRGKMRDSICDRFTTAASRNSRLCLNDIEIMIDAALEPLLNPTQSMLDVGLDQMPRDPSSRGGLESVFRAMIGAIKEGK